MDAPKTGGELYRALCQHYSTEELEELSRKSEIGRSTLENWKAHPDRPVRSQARAHYRRIFHGEGAHQPDDLAALLAEVRDLLRSLLTLEKQGRATAVVKAKRHGGAA